jgi:hypothetical protein
VRRFWKLWITLAEQPRLSRRTENHRFWLDDFLPHQASHFQFTERAFNCLFVIEILRTINLRQFRRTAPTEKREEKCRFGRGCCRSLRRVCLACVRHGKLYWAGGKVLQTARKSISHWGVTTIEDVTAQVREADGAAVDLGFVTKVLKSQDNFEWLDEAAGWFWLSLAKRNSLLTQIDKVLSVAPQIPVSELRTGVSRHHRREGFAPPQRVLLTLCQRLPGYRVDQTIVSADSRLKWEDTLADSERTLAGVLKEHGPVMERQRLEELCSERGLKRDMFYVHLTYSPIIERFAQGVYGLRGSSAPPGLAESLMVPRSKSKLIQDYGWTDNGSLEVCYRLSKAIVSSGVVGVPVGIRQYLQGRFILKTVDETQIGTLVIKDTSGWGLGPFFRRRGGEAGDALRIRFDLKQKVAIVALGEGTVEEEKTSSLISI